MKEVFWGRFIFCDGERERDEIGQEKRESLVKVGGVVVFSFS